MANRNGDNADLLHDVANWYFSLIRKVHCICMYLFNQLYTVYFLFVNLV